MVKDQYPEFTFVSVVSRIYLVPSGRAKPRLKLTNDFHSSAGSSKEFLPLFLDVHDVIIKCYL